MKIEYPAEIKQDQDGNYVVQFLDMEEAFTEGADMEEALFNASEVLSLCLEQRIADKKEIPIPSEWPSVQRLEDPKNSTTIKMLTKAANAYGKKVGT